MKVYRVDVTHWAIKLAPQLTGCAQQAYTAMNTDAAKDYEEVKKAILCRNNIMEEMYQQRFRAECAMGGEDSSSAAAEQVDR